MNAGHTYHELKETLIKERAAFAAQQFTMLDNSRRDLLRDKLRSASGNQLVDLEVLIAEGRRLVATLPELQIVDRVVTLPREIAKDPQAYRQAKADAEARGMRLEVAAPLKPPGR
ncbi:MAG: hypothetical protein HQL38_16770 [Alphaproteobacteria bacterium]|nr:hypothetical protein [Alphaproteobacteria bacterium]MBF0394331.1 hypothetical protein [Alphaproteobacteria bacterium]